ncbi:hypothetical protein [Limisalsivibrio acetivorans]|uniref:hypothetical protein n=1 Tax=Limisalsivibrio acetivorans TaxID=1304888 RepID=UPI00047C13A2|nr:hypothetical protein [Limisalsivibrio acetivorans]
MKTLILVMACVLFVCGCTKRAWYDGMRDSQSFQCSRYDGEQRDRCLEGSGMSYDEYRRTMDE